MLQKITGGCATKYHSLVLEQLGGIFKTLQDAGEFFNRNVNNPCVNRSQC